MNAVTSDWSRLHKSNHAFCFDGPVECTLANCDNASARGTAVVSCIVEVLGHSEGLGLRRLGVLGLSIPAGLRVFF